MSDIRVIVVTSDRNGEFLHAQHVTMLLTSANEQEGVALECARSSAYPENFHVVDVFVRRTYARGSATVEMFSFTHADIARANYRRTHFCANQDHAS